MFLLVEAALEGQDVGIHLHGEFLEALLTLRDLTRGAFERIHDDFLVVRVLLQQFGRGRLSLGILRVPNEEQDPHNQRGDPEHHPLGVLF